MGWCPVQASLELRTSIGTILQLFDGDLEDEINHHVVDRARVVFDSKSIVSKLNAQSD